MSTSIKIDSALAAEARSIGSGANRSLAEQASYWMRLGRNLERLPTVSVRRVQDVLKAKTDFDGLADEEKSLALAQLESELFQPKGEAEFHAAKSQAGLPYTVLDASGDVVEVQPNGRKRVIAAFGERAAD